MNISKGTRNAIIAILAIAMVAAFYAGCSRENETGVTTPATTNNDINEQLPRCEYTDQFTVLRTEFAVYSEENQTEFQTGLESGEVQYAISKFNSLGYALDLEHSSVMEGAGVPNWPGGSDDTIDVKLVNIILRYQPDSLNSFVWISCVCSPNHPELPGYITTSIWSFVLPESDISEYETVELGADEYGADRYIWIKDIVLPFIPKDNDLPFATWSWKKWGLCTGVVAVAGCGGSAIGCIFTGPGYAACLASGCTGSVVRGAIACAIAQWF